MYFGIKQSAITITKKMPIEIRTFVRFQTILAISRSTHSNLRPAEVFINIQPRNFEASVYNNLSCWPSFKLGLTQLGTTLGPNQEIHMDQTESS